MSQQVINIGTTPNDGTGDSLRTAFNKINNNFSELYSLSNSDQLVYTVGNTNQTILEVPSASFTRGKFDIYSIDPVTANSQTVSIDAFTFASQTDVKFSAHSTVFNGNPVTTYSMDVDSGSVRLKVDPFVTGVLQHFVTYRVEFMGIITTGLEMETEDGLGALVTEENALVFITTE